MLSVTIPPSVHVDTGTYVWLVEPWKVTAPAAPPWLLHLWRPADNWCDACACRCRRVIRHNYAVGAFP